MPEQVWYAAYGSNLSRQRFLCYLIGGKPVLGKKEQRGSGDPALPTEDRQITVAHRLYFALPDRSTRTGNWGRGGVAFIDPESDPHAKTVCRMWRITREQYQDVRQQEGLAWYDREILLGEAGGLPILTVSHGCRLGNVLPPSGAYLKTIAIGLRETAGFTDEEIAAYFLDKTGIRGMLRRTAVEEMLGDLGPGCL
jgi:hypothetical protein